jgi:nitrogen-specific signal transduction histidine kinase
MSIVDAHGGTIEATSTGDRTVFQVVLPDQAVPEL